MDFIIPILFEKFKKIPEGFYKRTSKYFTTDKIVKRLFKKSTLEIQNIKLRLLSDHGDDEFLSETNSRIPEEYIHVFTPCIIREDFVIEVADIVCKPYGNIEIINHRYGIIPDELRQFGVMLFQGKRPFYYHGKTISLQIRFSFDDNDIDDKAEELFLALPKTYQDVKAQQWIGSPRVKIHLRSVKDNDPHHAHLG